MRTKAAVGTILAGAALLVAVSAQQTQPLPGPGSGVVTVTGTVDVGNIPAVTALQAGVWKVTLAERADVRLTGLVAPDFLQSGGRYTITWGPADSEAVTIVEIGAHGWVRVESKTQGQFRWLNIATARSVEQMR